MRDKDRSGFEYFSRAFSGTIISPFILPTLVRRIYKSQTLMQENGFGSNPSDLEIPIGLMGFGAGLISLSRLMYVAEQTSNNKYLFALAIFTNAVSWAYESKRSRKDGKLERGVLPDSTDE